MKKKVWIQSENVRLTRFSPPNHLSRATNMSTNGQNGPTSNNGPMHNGPSSSSGLQAGNGSSASGVQSISGPPVADLLSQLEDYSPAIPDAVTQHYLSSSGFNTDDPRIVRLISLAAQKYISDIANDALQHCKMRGAGVTNKKNKDRKYVLSNEDLGAALADQGITLKKPPYFV